MYFWWLTEEPVPDEIENDIIVSDESLSKIANLLEESKGTYEICPNEDTLGDFALGLEVADKQQIDAHISKCRDCQDMLAAYQESEAIRKGEKPIHPYLSKLFTENSNK